MGTNVEDGMNRTEALDPIEDDDDMLRDGPEVEPGDLEQAAAEVPVAITEGDMDVDGEDDGAAPEVLEDTPLLPEERLPTLEEYQETWDRLYRQHTRTVKGNFGPSNLVPDPLPQLFQNCPWVPFHTLTDIDASEEAHARLARCFPLSGLTPSTMAEGVERYSHCQGEVNFRSERRTAHTHQTVPRAGANCAETSKP